MLFLLLVPLFPHGMAMNSNTSIPLPTNHSQNIHPSLTIHIFTTSIHLSVSLPFPLLTSISLSYTLCQSLIIHPFLINKQSQGITPYTPQHIPVYFTLHFSCRFTFLRLSFHVTPYIHSMYLIFHT